MKIINILLKCVYNTLILSLNKLIKKKQCYICGEQFLFFKKYNGGFKNVNSFLLNLRLIGSDLDNFACLYCGSHDRERHLYMFFDKLCFWDKMRNSRILHFAPEENLKNKILQLNPIKYVKADNSPTQKDEVFIDATNITFGANEFDIVIANHILEHIKDYKKAISEIYRVLSVTGVAILQVPYSKILEKNFEDNGLDTSELRNFFYGQEDHVRIFSEKELVSSIQNTGFFLKIIDNDIYFSDDESAYYGVNKCESLWLAVKY